MRKLLIGVGVWLWALTATSVAFAQCGTSIPGGTLCGNGSTSQGLNGPLTNPTLGRNGSAGGALTLRGSTSGAATIRVPAAAGTGTVFQLPSTNGTPNQVLITDGSGITSWTTAGSGTVSSVALAMPGIFAVSGSPVTGIGTLTATLNTQSANLVWAGPTTGAASAPTFRSLVGADLPNPTSGSLGGVQSFVAVGSQWIRQISTSGVPTASQPAFTDISGTLAATQCPNPSASTIGCVQSLAAVTSKWINTISTSGVPSATQPNFTDISGSVSPSQLPSIGNNQILANISGGTSIPAGNTMTSLLDILGATQGTILYRNASAWVPLAVGTDGQVLTTHAAAANPTWTTVTGTGTVTSVAAGTGLTGGPITTTGTLSFASIANHEILANISGGSATPIANTMTAILDDTMGSTQGNILYRGASNWLVLPPGTNGQVLTQGASTPSWASAGTVSNVTITAGTGLTSTGTCNISTSGTCTLLTSLTNLTNSLGSNIAFSTGAFTDGPSVAQGTSGTWHASGSITWTDSASGGVATCKLWDGTTIIDSATNYQVGSSQVQTISLSGNLSSPAANIRISCESLANTTTSMLFAAGSTAKSSTVSVFRIQ